VEKTVRQRTPAAVREEPSLLRAPDAAGHTPLAVLVRIHFIIVMIRWTGLAPWEFE